MKQASFSCSHLSELPGIAAELLRWAGPVRVWMLEGPLGAGKTTLVQALCRQLGVEESVSSPTFGLVHQYADRAGKAVYHFDCYRLLHWQEAIEIGVEEYLFSGDYCFIEWPGQIQPLWPDTYIYLRISTDPTRPTYREINIQQHG